MTTHDQPTRRACAARIGNRHLRRVWDFADLPDSSPVHLDELFRTLHRERLDLGDANERCNLLYDLLICPGP